MSELVVHPDGALSKDIVYFGRKTFLCCDGRCDLAFGRSYSGVKYWPAPEDPGTYEGTDGKPVDPDNRLNKWCARECERSTIAPIELSVPA